jgi:hypothetical protein
MTDTRHHADAATARRIAVAAQCDPRTVARYLAGAPVRGTELRRRLARAVRRHRDLIGGADSRTGGGHG